MAIASQFLVILAAGCCTWIALAQQHHDGRVHPWMFGVTASLLLASAAGLPLLGWMLLGRVGVVRVVVDSTGGRTLQVRSRRLRVDVALPADELVCRWRFRQVVVANSSAYIHHADILVVEGSEPVVCLQGYGSGNRATPNLDGRAGWAYGRLRPPRGCPRLRVVGVRRNGRIGPAVARSRQRRGGPEGPRFNQYTNTSAIFMALLHAELVDLTSAGWSDRSIAGGEQRHAAQRVRARGRVRPPTVSALAERLDALAAQVEGMAAARPARRWRRDHVLSAALVLVGATVAFVSIRVLGSPGASSTLGTALVSLAAVAFMVTMIGLGLLLDGRSPNLRDPAARSLRELQAELHAIRHRRALVGLRVSAGSEPPARDIERALVDLDGRLARIDSVLNSPAAGGATGPSKGQEPHWTDEWVDRVRRGVPAAEHDRRRPAGRG